ncbi:GNAT superfamily N-acetyltransferase [Xanthobacter flavus]|uniref:GNAT superfamily N-acetyltransferase n=1 Tax=Xanthobacter flavus TaxID=281 RepID=A0A9W6CN52_XANFL|nr:GNAT family N-acetyltransferase [Xanthobacter flavus]MDR6334527.1 GNAT superfamily N-acetyltransferase [Xanthobacter flavus]GLI23455.1 hypothetical protein XFLAVUS301_31290 [Xanthobacter flavus]
MSDVETAARSPETATTIEFKRLTAACQRGAFSCGEREIDTWFRSKSLKHHNNLYLRVMTAHLTGNPAPMGFYALSINLENESELEPRNRPIFRNTSGLFASVHLSWIAISRPMQRQGHGTTLMGAVLDDFYQIAVRTGIFALTLSAINPDVAQFYKKLGFVEYGSQTARPKLFLPSRSVIELHEQQS